MFYPPSYALAVMISNAQYVLDLALPAPLSSTVAQVYLTTNDVPDDCHLGEIHHSLSRLRQDLFQIDEHIHALESCMMLLHHRRRELKEAADKHQRVLSLVRRIPPELIAKIMGHTLEEEASCLDTSRGPWPLSHVCRRWRNVALSFPAIWSRMVVKERVRWRQKFPWDCTRDFPRSSKQILQTWLRRSKSTHLSIVYHAFTTDASSELLDMLMAESGRWHSATLNIDAKGLAHLGPIRDRLPCLHALHLNMLDPVDNAHALTLDAFSVAPELRTLHLGAHMDATVFKNVLFPWHQIQIISSRHLLGTSLETLRYFPSITSFSGWINSRSLSGSPFELSQLRKLETSAGPWMDYVSLPSLEEITLSEGQNDLQYLSALVWRSACPLTSIAFENLTPQLSAQLPDILRPHCAHHSTAENHV